MPVDENKYLIKPFYQGGYSSFEPKSGDSFTGYQMSGTQIGMSTDPRVGNILQEVSTKLSSGIKTMEVSAVGADVFESIPKQHLKELDRLTKLTGMDITLHAPISEPSGMDQQGKFSETSRLGAERQMLLAVERAHEIKPNKAIPVTFHSSAGVPGDILQKGAKFPEEIYIVNKDTGALAGKIPIRESKFPGEESLDPKLKIKKQNEEYWKSNLSNLAFNSVRAADYLSHYGLPAKEIEEQKKQGMEIDSEKGQILSNFQVGKTFLEESYREIKNLFDVAYRNSQDKKDKEILENYRKEIEKKVNEINKDPQSSHSLELRKKIIDEGLETFNKIDPPEMITSLKDFARDKTTTTFGNVAFDAWKKIKGKGEVPIISIENPPAGGGFSTGKELKEIVEKSREQFVKRAMSEGYSEEHAKKEAEKILGATWDVGHINMMRKFGYEGKDIVKETEAIAPFVKHVHLSDNFGMEHTELPMGMGNVPMKEIMEKLEKGTEGFKDVKKIIEAGNWWQHFKTSPLTETFEGFGSSMYSGGSGPYWTQRNGLQQGYFGGYGLFLPQGNYDMFGAGFSQLPSELGGQKPGTQGSRMSGKGME